MKLLINELFIILFWNMFVILLQCYRSIFFNNFTYNPIFWGILELLIATWSNTIRLISRISAFMNKDGPLEYGRLPEEAWGYCALHRSRTGQICFIDVDKLAMFLNIVPGGVIYGGGGLSGIHWLFSDVIGVVWLLRSLLESSMTK